MLSFKIGVEQNVEAFKWLMVALMISLLIFKVNFSEPYKRTVSNWSSEEFWRVESKLFMPLRSPSLWTE